MRIALIGGLERAEPHFERLAHDAGHEIVFHDGRTGGRGAQVLASLCERSELVVVLTEVNNHCGVQLARRVLRERGRSPSCCAASASRSSARCSKRSTCTAGTLRWRSRRAAAG